MLDSQMASNPSKVWREMPRPILSPVRANAKVAKMYQLLHDQYVIEGDLTKARETRAQWKALGGDGREAGADIEEYSQAEAHALRVDLMQSYLTLFQKGNTAREHVQKGVFALFALWRERRLANTELCNFTLRFCDSPDQMRRVIIDGMGGGDEDEDGSAIGGDDYDRPDPQTYELLVDKMADEPKNGPLEALNLVNWLREKDIPLSKKTEVWARRENWRCTRRKKRKNRKRRERHHQPE
jgi:hypothetical protein